METKTIKLNIIGMSCNRCVTMVKRALNTIPNVNHVEVNLTDKLAEITFNGTPPPIDTIIDTLRQAGYDASPNPLIN